MAGDKNADKAKADADKPESGEGGEASKPKGRFAALLSRKMLMILAPVLLLVVGGGVYFFLFTGGEEVAGEHGEASADGHAAAGGEGHGDAHAGGEGGEAEAHHPVFFEVPDILVNVSSDGGKPVFLKLAVSLEVDGASHEEIAASLEPIMPRVVDQLQTYLRELRLEDLSGSAALFRLKEELLRRVNLAADPIQVKGVLFREMIVQ
jgi:flagellar FliL protein